MKFDCKVLSVGACLSFFVSRIAQRRGRWAFGRSSDLSTGRSCHLVHTWAVANAPGSPVITSSQRGASTATYPAPLSHPSPPSRRPFRPDLRPHAVWWEKGGGVSDVLLAETEVLKQTMFPWEGGRKWGFHLLWDTGFVRWECSLWAINTGNDGTLLVRMQTNLHQYFIHGNRNWWRIYTRTNNLMPP